MPSFINHYAALGLPITTPLRDIRSTHRQLALKHHPDRIRDPAARPEGAAKFRSIQEAYDILNDPVQREAYHARWADELRRYQNGFDAGDMEAEGWSKPNGKRQCGDGCRHGVWCLGIRGGDRKARSEKTDAQKEQKSGRSSHEDVDDIAAGDAVAGAEEYTDSLEKWRRLQDKLYPNWESGRYYPSSGRMFS